MPLLRCTMLFLTLVVSLDTARAATVYLLRHAEKQATTADNNDPGLTAAGLQRAHTAAQILADIDFTAIYSSDFRRTRLTAEAIKGERAQALTLYDPRELEAFADQLKAAPADSVFVVVGHSNTTPTLAHLLSGKPVASIDESVYHNLYRVGMHSDGSATLDLLTIPPVSNSAPLQALPLDPNRISEHTQTFRMLLNNEPVGESVWTYRYANDEEHGPVLILEEDTKLPEYEVDTQITAVLARASLQPVSLRASGPMFAQASDIAARFDQGRITGHSSFPRQPFEAQGQLTLDQSVAAPYFERTAAIMLAAAVQADPEHPFSFRWFNTYNNEFRRIQVEHLGTDTVTVPAGTFTTDLIRYQGGSPSQVFYVSRELPRRVVKIEVVGSPWVYEML